MMATLASGLFGLAGVALGSWLTSVSARKLNEQVTREARIVRKVAQLERLNRLLDNVNSQFLSSAYAATQTVNLGVRQQIDHVDDASLTELGFLTRVYLPEGRLYFYEIRSLVASMNKKVVEIYASTRDQLALTTPLSAIRKLESEFVDSVEHLREALVESARAIERE